MAKVKKSARRIDISERLELEFAEVKQKIDDFNEECARFENNLLKRVFRAVLGRKPVMADFQLFKIVSLEGQPHRYNVYLKAGNILLGEVVKTYSSTEGFQCVFKPHRNEKIA